MNDGLPGDDAPGVSPAEGDGFFFILKIELCEVVLDHEFDELFQLSDIDHGVFRGDRMVIGRKVAPFAGCIA